jgi:DNA-binding HxlR family transcriptional regulator
VAEYKRFRELARELIEISDQICDLRLKDLEGVREVETKKKRHRRKSAR